MRNVCETPRQLDLLFETSESENTKLGLEVTKLSNVVSIDFTQQRNLKQKSTESMEDELVLEYVLSNARKLSW